LHPLVKTCWSKLPFTVILGCFLFVRNSSLNILLRIFKDSCYCSVINVHQNCFFIKNNSFCCLSVSHRQLIYDITFLFQCQVLFSTFFIYSFL
jgi:hypothetical protein